MCAKAYVWRSKDTSRGQALLDPVEAGSAYFCCFAYSDQLAFELSSQFPGFASHLQAGVLGL